MRLENQLRLLPSIDRLTARLRCDHELQSLSNSHLTALVQEATENLRASFIEKNIKKGRPKLDAAEKIMDYLSEEVKWLHHLSFQQVVNGAGVVIHTNLGRSLLAKVAQDAAQDASAYYCNLEYDLRSGERGSRHTRISQTLTRLMRVPGAMVVNNNAAATFLALNALSSGKEAIISRGQLVEIGGSFRMPDVMQQSGAIMREVGATNKTRLSDYAEAINENTGVIIDVHTSNYRIQGFTGSVLLTELAKLAHDHNLPLIADLGSGALLDLSRYGLPKEPTVQESLGSGADAVMFSGDKLLGGPQAGIIIGDRDIIERMKKNPFTRMFRCDKMTLAALDATLDLYFDEEKAVREIPTLRLITRSQRQIQQSAHKTLRYLRRNISTDFRFERKDGFSEAGGGSLPTLKLPTSLIAVMSGRHTPHRLDAKLRQNRPPIIGRIHGNLYLLDQRTLLPGDEKIIAQALNRL
ncbi:MAG: L-seryl-tRNA(Sec) selenium transferase [Candidatus Cloacimonetes bacterium 4572_55]|nr:MAG: L-seryl-tRNA(Sec) selenium transferase [Candidatus Cloacimonetes bacterium 4572_55]